MQVGDSIDIPDRCTLERMGWRFVSTRGGWVKRTNFLFLSFASFICCTAENRPIVLRKKGWIYMHFGLRGYIYKPLLKEFGKNSLYRFKGVRK